MRPGLESRICRLFISGVQHQHGLLADGRAGAHPVGETDDDGTVANLADGGCGPGRARDKYLMTRRFLLLAVLAAANLPGHQFPEPKNWTAAEDHQNMLDELGIKALRPGPSGNENAPNHANYDESKANPYPNLPAVLTLKNG